MFLKWIFSIWIVLFSGLLLYGETYEEILQPCEIEQIAAANEIFSQLCQNDSVKNSLVFTKLQGGMTRARLYLFDLDGQKFVLRFLDPRIPSKQRQSEIQACKTAYSLGIGPRCVSCDENALLMIMPFIQGHSLSSHDLADPEMICRLGQMIHTLHSYSEKYPTRYSLLERLQIHYQKGKSSGIAYPTGFDQVIASVLNESSPSSLVPCHGDLNPSNILISDHDIFIIDWANATLDDPFVDLSYISLLVNMTEEQERIFLRAYLDREAVASEIARLKDGQAKICLITATIWLRFSENAEDQQIPFLERVAKIDAELNDPALKDAHDYLREGKVVDVRSDSKEAIRSYALSFYKAYLSKSKMD